jgi:diguanylate cyclase (GGDEF)-like protein/PAS domain S-box-containing protein
LLVVDDEPKDTNALARRLAQSGFAVDWAGSGDKALEALREREIDLVLLDSMASGDSGIEILRLLRATQDSPRPPVILMTAPGDSAKIAEALEVGADDYITKPIDYTVALARIRSQLSRKHVETALRHSEVRYDLTARGANDGLWDWDLTRGRIIFSPRWKAMVGCDDDTVGDTPDEWFSRVHPEDVAGLCERLRNLEGPPNSVDTFEHQHRMRHRNGSYRWMLTRGLVMRGSDGRPVRMAGSLSDITTTKTFDSLTGLPNRFLFLDRVADAVRRSGGAGIAVLFLDLDRFKIVNESLGHKAGDQLLAAVGERLRKGFRGTAAPEIGGNDVVARLGGDEFGVLVEGIADTSAACRLADRVLATLRPPFQVNGRDVFCSASVGIALAGNGCPAPEEILRDADTAMCAAKSRGKAQWAVFDGSMREQVLDRLQMESDLSSALERGQFEIVYQPKVNLGSGALCGFEALLRWRHPERGLLMPEQFIPLAEETGLIFPIGLWALREACLQARRWQLEYPGGTPIEISVNVSPRQFRQTDLVKQVAHVLEESGLAPASLQLEVTESVLLDDLDSALATLARLKELGVGLKIDDFGTGYSCLRYLCKLPFDSIKIDRSFTEHLAEEDSKGAEVVRTIVEMAHKLGMSVVAEGVEDPAQADRLRELGCEFAQGYHYCPPVAAEEAERLIRQPEAWENLRHR